MLAVFGGSLLLIPSIGGEFMPHLDEGALWVRATTPYTISFEEASKLLPQIRDILLSFPQVTTVANELGRPDDGTDPTGFFNNEFYVGLKPYDDSAWSGCDPHQAATDRSRPEEAGRLPGHHLQLHAARRGRGGRGGDRVEERAGGQDLRRGPERPGREGGAGQRVSCQKMPGITEITVVRELGQPSLTITPDRAKLARYGLNVSDINTLIETAHGRARRPPR